MNSKHKGKRGELEVAALLRAHGFEDARRGVQYQGGPDSADIVNVAGCHCEVKRCERGSLYDWLDQAIKDAQQGNTPVVFHRKSRRDWVVILNATDFLTILRQAEYGKTV